VWLLFLVFVLVVDVFGDCCCLELALSFGWCFWLFGVVVVCWLVFWLFGVVVVFWLIVGCLLSYFVTDTSNSFMKKSFSDFFLSSRFSKQSQL